LNFSLPAADRDVRKASGVRRERRFVEVLTFRGAILEINAADEATEASPDRSAILELTPLLSPRFSSPLAAQKGVKKIFFV
jgi:hypothetical protein